MIGVVHITRLLIHDKIELDRCLSYLYLVCQRCVQSLEPSEDGSVIGIKLLYRIIDLQVDNRSHFIKNQHCEQSAFNLLENTAMDKFSGLMTNDRAMWKTTCNFENKTVHQSIQSFTWMTLVVSIQITAFKHYFAPTSSLPHF